jgi:hypothetical protein
MSAYGRSEMSVKKICKPVMVVLRKLSNIHCRNKLPVFCNRESYMDSLKLPSRLRRAAAPAGGAMRRLMSKLEHKVTAATADRVIRSYVGTKSQRTALTMLSRLFMDSDPLRHIGASPLYLSQRLPSVESNESIQRRWEQGSKGAINR